MDDWSFWVRLAYAAGILVVARYLSHWVRGLAAQGLDRTDLDPLVRRTLTLAVRPLILLVGLSAAVHVLNLSAISNAIAAALGGATIAIGLGLKGYLSDAAAGALLLTVRPFQAGDAVVLGGKASGQIREVGFFMTVLDSYDGNTYFVPNGEVASALIENISRRGTRRVLLVYPVNPDLDLDAAREALLNVVRADGRALAEPAPAVELVEVTPDWVSVRLAVWSKNEHHGALTASAREEGLKALRQLGIYPPKRPPGTTPGATPSAVA
ncbi:mechanosensitive ion channel family protein [Myxococcota bacterium]|nr:mechanosensitive ion channel family protein [Myxococcota bacterium]